MRRTVWFSLGVGVTIYAQRRVKRTAERFVPARIRHDVESRARRAAREARHAIDDGRLTYRREEERLRDELDLHRSFR